MNNKKAAALELVTLVCRVLEDKKGGEITVLDVSAHSSITDYLVLATATSAPHLRALRVELEKAIDAAKVPLLGMESVQESGWMIMDAFDVMVHLFLAEPRERYGLERLWRDAPEISVEKLLRPPVEKPRAKPARKPAAAKPRPRAAAKKKK